MSKYSIDQAHAIKKRIIELRESYPDMTMAHIGRRLDVSREYVRQILNLAGLRTRRIGPAKRFCKCGNELKHNGRYCSESCFSKDHRVVLVCFTCNKPFRRLKSQYKRDVAIKKNHAFCSRKCYLKWWRKS